MTRTLLATTAVAALVVGAAHAQTDGVPQTGEIASEHEVVVSSGDTVVIDAERLQPEIVIRFSAEGTGAVQQTPEQDGEAPADDATVLTLPADEDEADAAPDTTTADAPAEGEHVVADGGTVFVETGEEAFQLRFLVRLRGQDDAQVGEAAEDDDAETADE